ncbi:phage major capsid protein [Clostridium faecium]|uniref:Phage major capsid protein n=1 Tax=Clostridium faecium TaxID=2762223 RepID=A0ABR8YRC6_9CLOT|nr:phage major capsid protein [Clostridium faecium]MBD8046692.1 phage major capsid protein [Clostridium faecium]
MRNMRDLIDSKEELIKKCEDMLNEAKMRGCNLTKEQRNQFDDYTEEIKRINESIDNELSNYRSSEPIKNNPGESMGWFDEPKIAPSSKVVSKSYKGMFYGNEKVNVSNGGFNNFEEFLYTVHSGRADQRLVQCSMVEGVPAFGGFAVPEEYGAFLMDKSIEEEIIRPRAAVWPMGSETKKVPAFDGADRTNGLLGGISGQWIKEGETGIKCNGKLRLIELTAKKLACFSQASNELIADGMSFEEVLANGLIKAMGWYMDYAFINGTGEGQPLGIINDPALITVAKEQGQASSTITYNNVVQMFSRLAPSCFNNALWIANPSIIPQFLTMTITIGTGGAQVPVFREESGRFTLLGKEIIFTEKCPALGAKGDLILVDLSQYAIGLRKEIALDRSNAPGWTEDMTDYRVIVRVDGKGLWDKPVKPKNGTTLSWAVALEDRK